MNTKTILMMAFLLTTVTQAKAQTNPIADIENIGTKMALLICEVDANAPETDYSRACGLSGISNADNYVAQVTLPVIRTFTTCKIYQDLAERIDGTMSGGGPYNPFHITGTGKSSLKRFVDDTCAVASSSTRVNQDDGKNLHSSAAVILLSPLGPFVANILTIKGIAHEVDPKRLREQVNSWLTNPGDAARRGDIGQALCRLGICL